MTKELGGINYKESHAMIFGNTSYITSGLNNNSNSSINNPKTSDFKIGLIISLIVITLIISILGYKRLKKLLKN